MTIAHAKKFIDLTNLIKMFKQDIADCKCMLEQNRIDLKIASTADYPDTFCSYDDYLRVRKDIQSDLEDCEKELAKHRKKLEKLTETIRKSFK